MSGRIRCIFCQNSFKINNDFLFQFHFISIVIHIIRNLIRFKWNILSIIFATGTIRVIFLIT